MVKPDIWIDEGFLSLSIPARLLWIGIISGADDEGRGLATDRCLKARIFPGDEITLEEVRKMRDELKANVNVRFYEVEGREYYQLTKWKDHQKVEYPKPSTLPEPTFTEDSSKIHRTSASNELTNKLINKQKVSTPSAPTRSTVSVPKETYAEGVDMKKEEYLALVGQYSERVIKLAIEKVASQQIKTGKKYKSPRGAILQWGIRAALEEIKKLPPERKEAPKPKCPECSKPLERDHGYWSCVTHGRREDVE